MCLNCLQATWRVLENTNGLSCHLSLPPFARRHSLPLIDVDGEAIFELWELTMPRPVSRYLLPADLRPLYGSSKHHRLMKTLLTEELSLPCLAFTQDERRGAVVVR